jgi:hypothetical protein
VLKAPLSVLNVDAAQGRKQEKWKWNLRDICEEFSWRTEQATCTVSTLLLPVKVKCFTKRVKFQNRDFLLENERSCVCSPSHSANVVCPVTMSPTNLAHTSTLVSFWSKTSKINTPALSLGWLLKIFGKRIYWLVRRLLNNTASTVEAVLVRLEVRTQHFPTNRP